MGHNFGHTPSHARTVRVSKDRRLLAASPTIIDLVSESGLLGEAY